MTSCPALAETKLLMIAKQLNTMIALSRLIQMTSSLITPLITTPLRSISESCQMTNSMPPRKTLYLKLLLKSARVYLEACWVRSAAPVARKRSARCSVSAAQTPVR